LHSIKGFYSENNIINNFILHSQDKYKYFSSKNEKKIEYNPFNLAKVFESNSFFIIIEPLFQSFLTKHKVNNE